MSDPSLSDTYFENKMALVWTTLNSLDLGTLVGILFMGFSDHMTLAHLRPIP